MSFEKVKYIIRWTLLGVIINLSYKVTSPQYLEVIGKLNLGEYAIPTIVGSVLGALTFIIKFYFDTKPFGGQ